MSSDLWRFFLENDVDGFRQHLAHATYSSTAPKIPGGFAGGSIFKVGSPGVLATSLKVPFKSRKSAGNAHTGRAGGVNLTRGDINAKDAFGRTLLHHAASQAGDGARDFAKVLLELPYLDLYAQDAESGWTALHRALYYGNISTAQALMQRDVRDAIDYTTTASHTNAGGLVKIKDNEGNSPFEVFGLSIAPRVIQSEEATLGSGNGDGENSVDLNDDGEDEKRQYLVPPSVDINGDEVFVFGSNKNITLGTGDEDDRHYPERLYLERPEHLVKRLHHDYLVQRQKYAVVEDLSSSVQSLGHASQLPAHIVHKPIVIQDVAMSKLHTAVLTTDPIANLYICGFGPGGRLGTGDESTCFSYMCILGGGLARRRVSNIALGQDHCIAICSQGEVFTWGSNRCGQLGYALPEVLSTEAPMQLLPRQLYGYVKKELVVGAAASATHSAIFTANALYTFGKNEGQLGLTDADARSLEIQPTPRRIAPTVLQAGIRSVSAIDRATTVLLESHEVVVFTHYGWTKVTFQLQGFTNYFISDTIATRYNEQGNVIHKITSGGHTIAAMSTFGEVFTIEVPKVAGSVPVNVSTTNPTKARNALPQPARVWSIRKAHMSAVDIAVGQDGSIILCTSSGSVWRKEKRANIKSVRLQGTAKAKDYKFVRVSNLTRAVAVRSNAFGAFAAVRKDSEVTRQQVAVQPMSMWSDLFPLLCFCKYGESPIDDESSEAPQLRFWTSTSRIHSPADVKRAIVSRVKAEGDVLQMCQRHEPLSDSPYNVWIASTVTEVRIPVHAFVLMGRSRVLRAALAEFQQSYFYGIPDVLNIEYGADGQIQILFQGADFLTLANLVLYLYTDEVIDVWHYTSKALQSAPRYRAVRVELMKIASALELSQLERAARLMVDPPKSLCQDFELAFMDSDLLSDADVLIELSNDDEQYAHSALLCARCPFFDGLFNGRAGGMWMSSRRAPAEDGADVMKVDLKHVDINVFQLVMRHIYADTGVELFDDIVTQTFEDFAELVLEVMSVANELMIDRLAEICQHVLGKFVTVRNVCWLLNVIAECTVNEFKHAALEYICLNLETMLEQRLLDELDPEILAELDEIVQQNQLAYMPFARSQRAHDELIERYPGLPELIDQGRERRIDSMRLRSRLVDDEFKVDGKNKFRVGSYEKDATSPSLRSRASAGSRGESSPRSSPMIRATDTRDDLPFEMDEDRVAQTTNSSTTSSPNIRARPDVEGSQVSPSFKSHSELGQSYGTDVASSIPRSANLGDPALDIARSTDHRTPWQSSPIASKKVDLRDIMDSTSASRVSNITQSLKSSGAGPLRSSQKMSQKERKKQQQQMKDLSSPVDPPAETIAAGSTQQTSRPSPWQNVAQQRKSSSSIVSSMKARTEQARTSSPSRPSMTMRQTVAGAPSSGSPTPKQTRSTSTPTMAASSKATQPVIQSVRHTPTPIRPSALDAHTSMSDILAQQLGEKTAVKEAAAKRSLQEIQQEQEFQAWWDGESQRVQEEEAVASATTRTTTSRPGRARRGRGSGQRSSGQSGADAKPRPSRDNVTSQPPTQQHEQTNRRVPGSASRGQPRGRGRGRGRGPS